MNLLYPGGDYQGGVTLYENAEDMNRFSTRHQRDIVIYLKMSMQIYQRRLSTPERLVVLHHVERDRRRRRRRRRVRLPTSSS